MMKNLTKKLALASVFLLCSFSTARSADWAISLEFSVPNPGADSGKSKVTLVAGIDASASEGFDTLWDAPVFYDGGILQAYFSPPAGSATPLWNDFRSNQSTGPKSWTIHLNSNFNSVTLRWRIIPGSGCQNYPVTLSDAGGTPLIDPARPTPSGTATLSAPDTLSLTLDSPGPGGGIPSPPSSLFSPLQGRHGILLVWNKGSSPDVAGYNLYRSVASGQNYMKLNAELLTSQAYFDRALTPGTTYYYVVRSVNQVGCESNPSSEVALRAEGP
jgi:hypothetical protein